MRRLWIRTEASTAIGLGHLMRCMSLAEAAQMEGIETIFVIPPNPLAKALLERRDLSFCVSDAALGWLAKVESRDVVFYDGYKFTTKDFVAARDRGATVGAIDDFGYGSFPVDVLVNPNPPEEVSYATLEETLRLLGSAYALVGNKFALQRRSRGDESEHLLLTFGGCDTEALATQTLSVLDRERLYERVTLLIGPANIDAPSRYTSERRWLSVVQDPEDVEVVLGSADVAVTTASTTAWELLSMGVPSLLIVAVDNQQQMAFRACEAQAAVCLGTPSDVTMNLGPVLVRMADASFRRQLSASARSFVDGKGASRVLSALLGWERGRD